MSSLCVPRPQRGASIASICVGGLGLATTGLLDGLRATTHWRATELFASRHPQIEVSSGALFVDNGELVCSADAAGIACACTHRRGLSAAAAADAAHSAVIQLKLELDPSPL